MNKVILLNKRPVGKPVSDDFKFTEEQKPVAAEGQVLLKTRYVSVDPYLRGRMSSMKSYIPSFKLHEPIQSGRDSCTRQLFPAIKCLSTRVPVCGAISLYNETEVALGPRLQPILVKNSVLMQGFIVSNYASKFPQAILQLSTWLKEGKLTYTETIVNGFDQIPQAFIDLFEGKNEGKMIVKI